MKTRFDLEQEILQCWNIIDDLKLLASTKSLNEHMIESLSAIYMVKFEVLFATFEELLANKVIK